MNQMVIGATLQGSLPGSRLKTNMTALENGSLQLLKTIDGRLCIIKTS